MSIIEGMLDFTIPGAFGLVGLWISASWLSHSWPFSPLLPQFDTFDSAVLEVHSQGLISDEQLLSLLELADEDERGH